jgi:hypothetical protein
MATDEKFVYTDVESAVRKSVFWLCKNNGVDIYNKLTYENPDLVLVTGHLNTIA